MDSSLPFFFLVSNWLKFAAQKKGPAHFAEFGQISNLLILFVFLFSFSWNKWTNSKLFWNRHSYLIGNKVLDLLLLYLSCSQIWLNPFAADDGHFWSNIKKLEKKKKKKHWVGIHFSKCFQFFSFFPLHTHCVSLEKETKRKLEHFLIIHKTYSLGLSLSHTKCFCFTEGIRWAMSFFLALQLFYVTWIASIWIRI